jgi:mannose-6-phosphate isomerase-like protein (cupin superfamily)
MRAASWIVPALALTAAGCNASEPTATVQSPPLTIAPPAGPPVEARFVDVSSTPTSVPLGACQQLFVAAVRGAVNAGGQSLSVGDVLATTSGPVDLRGDGAAVVATTGVTPCNVPLRLVLASTAPELTFMGGAMHAHLDLDDRAIAPTAYVGRLAGNAAVPEHAHDKSWEILCAVEAAGTFTLGGQPQRLGPRTCVSVPPGTKHSWQPDPGSTLNAVQIYSPPGPEQRFKKMAAEGK